MAGQHIMHPAPGGAFQAQARAAWAADDVQDQLGEVLGLQLLHLGEELLVVLIESVAN